jgi:hypothetical protein
VAEDIRIRLRRDTRAAAQKLVDVPAVTMHLIRISDDIPVSRRALLVVVERCIRPYAVSTVAGAENCQSKLYLVKLH